MNELNKKIIIPAITFLVIAAIVIIVYNDGFIGFDSSKELGLSFFYEIQSTGLYLYLVMFIVFVSSNFYSIDYFRYQKNKFDNLIVSRIGYKKMFISNIKNVAISSLLFRMYCHFLSLFFINFYCPIHFNIINMIDYYPQFYIFSDSSLLSFIIYILLSSVGYMIFSIFIYSLIYIIKNIYVYRVSGIISQITLLVIPLIIYKSIQIESGIKSAFQLILFPFYIGFLLHPGLDNPNGNFNFNIIILIVISFIFYMIISSIILMIAYKERRQNG